jgi:serine/threonine-protein kinase
MGFVDKLRIFLQGSSRLNVSQRFEILREAIHGTMSSFYVVRDRETDEIFGLKVCDDEKREIFEGRFAGLEKPTEGEIGLSIDHPRIITTLDHGLTTEGHYYVLMEFIPGPGLNVLIKAKEPKLIGKRGTLIRQMAEGLSFVHQSGYIHRDVCPRNYMCNKKLTEIQLIDFGLTVPATKDFTQPGNRTGTPSYMAPEVVRRRKTDQRLDIFAFGVTAFQLITFDLPWPSQDVTGKVAMSHDTKKPMDIFELQPKLNRRLGETIMACMSVDRDDRPQSMEDFLRRTKGVADEFATE